MEEQELEKLRNIAYELWDDLLFRQRITMNWGSGWRILVDMHKCDPTIAHRLWSDYEKKRMINQWSKDASEPGKHDY